MKILILVLLVLTTFFPAALAYTKEENNINLTFYIANGYIEKSESFNASIAIISPAVYQSSSINLSVPPFRFYQLITTTSIAVISAGGGGGGTGLIDCPPNSHSIEGGRCACDFGYAYDEGKNCILNIPVTIRKAASSRLFIYFILGVIISGILLYIYLSREKEEREEIKKKLKGRAKEFREEPRESTKKLGKEIKNKIEQSME